MPLDSGFHFVDLTAVNANFDQAAATAVASNGIVVGSYAVNNVFNGFVWDTRSGNAPIVGIGYNDPAAQKKLSPAKYLGTRLLDINEKGQIVGRIDFQGTPMISYAYWIDLADAIKGAGVLPTDFKVLNAPPPDLPTGLANSFHAHGINAKGQIVGIYKDSGVAGPHGAAGTVGFLFTPDPSSADPWGGAFAMIGPAPGAQFTQLFGINNHGDVIGDSGVFTAGGVMQPFPYVWTTQAGQITATKLPVSLADGTVTFSIGHKIADSGTVVGEAQTKVSGIAIGWEGVFKKNAPNITADFQAETAAGVFGSTAAIGVNEPGWVVGSAVQNPDPNNPGAGSQAFVYVP